MPGSTCSQRRKSNPERTHPSKTREFIKRTRRLGEEEAQPLWEAGYEDLEFDADQTQDVSVIMGPVLSNWKKLRSILGVKSEKKKMVMKFVNEVSRDGTRIIGVLVPSDKVRHASSSPLQ